MEFQFGWMEEYLSLLNTYFLHTTTFQDKVKGIGCLLAKKVPVDAVVLSTYSKEQWQAFGWNLESNSPEEDLAQQLLERDEIFLTALKEDKVMEGVCLNRRTNPVSEQFFLGYRIGCESSVYGFLTLHRPVGNWNREEHEFLRVFCRVLGVAWNVEERMEQERRNSFVLNTVMDMMKTSIYVTDVENDRILFMNQAMREEFGLDDPEGKSCYKVLQTGEESRCAFCPVELLLKSPEKNPVIQWDEVNSINGRTYRNYDSLVPWMDGRLVHLQQSMDLTELKIANTDELTQLLTRRPGKIALQNTLIKAGKGGGTVTICLYDINNLKEVNDQFGHKEGDRLIQWVAETISNTLFDGEYAFRLSGDEFIVVFLANQKEARARLNNIQKILKKHTNPYEASFCFGLAEIRPNQNAGMEEAILLADERMYEQKRRFHILHNQQRLEKELMVLERSETFQYDKDLLYDALIQSTDDYPFICNMKTGIFCYAPAMVEEFDLPGQVIKNAAAVWGAKVHENDKAAFLEANQAITDGRSNSHCVEYRAMNRYGQWAWVRCRGKVEMDENGEATLFAGFITNLGRKNRIDSLTGMFNKREFEERISHHIASQPDQPIGIMILGIDNLKHINDLYNWTFGDEVIRVTAQRIVSMLPPEASLYRLDGDEFGLVMQNSTREYMKKLYDTVSYAFENQQEYDGKKYYCTLSAGSVQYPEDADTYLEIVKYASYALEYAKSDGKKCWYPYTPGLLEHRSRNLALMEYLRDSVENDFKGFSLCFQPLVDALDGRVLGAEALARWHCERFGNVSPVEFIPILEQTGMILPVGKWVLSAAVHQILPWLEWIPDFILNVNLSYQQIQGADFVPYLQEVLLETHFPAEHLILELTESYFAQETRHVFEVVDQIRGLGVGTAMDDFGTGYSTLSILKEMPVDLVKIDKIFIRDIRTSTFDATFIRFVVALCHDVGIRVCLEGVETEEENQIVSTMGLDVIQGYLYGIPLPAPEFEKAFCMETQSINEK